VIACHRVTLHFMWFILPKYIDVHSSGFDKGRTRSAKEFHSLASTHSRLRGREYTGTVLLLYFSHKVFTAEA